MENTLKCFSTWDSHNVFTIRIKGKGEFIKKIVSNLEEDFTAPHEDETESEITNLDEE